MPFDYKTIWIPDGFVSFEYQNCLLFRSYLVTPKSRSIIFRDLNTGLIQFKSRRLSLYMAGFSFIGAPFYEI